MWVTWTPLKTNSTGSSLPLTRCSYRGVSILSFQCFQTFLFAILNFWIVFTTSPRSLHLSQDGGGSIDVEEIRDIVVGLFRFATILLNLFIWLVRDSPEPNHFNMSPKPTNAVILEIPKDKGTDSYFTLISALFILTRLAGIEEDEDLLTACVSDVRWVNLSLDPWTMMSLCIKVVCPYPTWDTICPLIL